MPGVERSTVRIWVPRILIAAGDPGVRNWLREIVGNRLAIEEVEAGNAALERLAAAPPRILAVGDRLTDGTGAELLSHAAAAGHLGGPGGPIVLTLAGAGGAAPARGAAEAEEDAPEVPIFYRLSP